MRPYHIYKQRSLVPLITITFRLRQRVGVTGATDVGTALCKTLCFVCRRPLAFETEKAYGDYGLFGGHDTTLCRASIHNGVFVECTMYDWVHVLSRAWMWIKDCLEFLLDEGLFFSPGMGTLSEARFLRRRRWGNAWAHVGMKWIA